MTQLDKKIINEQISLMLGFTKHEINVNHKPSGRYCWVYPDKYAALAPACPMYECPDWIQMIDDYIAIKSIINKR